MLCKKFTFKTEKGSPGVVTRRALVFIYLANYSIVSSSLSVCGVPLS